MTATWILGTMTAVLAVMTIGSLSVRQAWWVRGFDFPRLQLLVLGVVTLLGTVVWLDFSTAAAWIIAVIAVGCTVFQARWIWPFTPLQRCEVRDAQDDTRGDRCIRFFVANVLTPNRNADALLAMVREHAPHVVVTVESDDWWQQQLDAGLGDSHPHALKCPRDNLYGMHLYSTWPLEDAEIQYLVEDDVPSMHVMLSTPGGQRVRLHVVHPAPASPTENPTSSERDAELVIVGRAVAGMENPVVVLGDLNDVAWSRTTRLFRKLSGLLDPRVGRSMFNTFHADHWWARWPLDHLFHSDHFTLVSMRRLPAFGSDHFPILVELAIERDEADLQSGIDPDAADRRRASRMADSESVDAAEVHKPDA